jgi:hypothetical protein
MSEPKEDSSSRNEDIMEAWKHVCMIVKYGIMEMSLMNMICERGQEGDRLILIQ